MNMALPRTVFLSVLFAVAVFIANSVSAHQGGHGEKEGWRGDDNQCGDHLTWIFNNKTLTIEGNGTMWDFDDDFHPPWFGLDDGTETIIIKEGVTSIGEYAFLSFIRVTNVGIPRSLISIGSYAFWYCKQLKQFIIPAGVTSIGRRAFENCGLKEISIPENVVFVGDGAFGSCASLTSITVDVKNTKFKSIDGVLFNNGGDILIQLPRGLSDTFTIPDHVSSIGDGAFVGCTFSTITIPNSVTSIGSYAFDHCQDLSSIILSESITSIGEGAFSNCESLAEITIPKSVESISNLTFFGCHALSHISIPDSITSIGSDAFSYCDSLVTIDIPDSVTRIGADAFSYCESLSRITIPVSITSIQPDTFGYCDNLADVNIHNNITSIGDHAFYYCKNLKQITIPDSVTSIGESAFSLSGLINVTIPDGVSSIGKKSFQDCSSLVTVFYQGSDYIQQSLFKSCNNLANVCVSPDYNYTQFGGVDVTSSSQICHDFQNTFNHCFKASYVDGIFVRDKKKLSVIEWEKQTNDCMEYQCINESGLVVWSKCNSTDDLNRFCIDDKCVANKETIEKKKAYVEIEIEDGVKVVDMNTQQILETIKIHCGIDIEEMMIGYENDEEGNLLRIMIYVDDEQTAKIIADGVRVIKQGC